MDRGCTSRAVLLRLKVLPGNLLDNSLWKEKTVLFTLIAPKLLDEESLQRDSPSPIQAMPLI